MGEPKPIKEGALPASAPESYGGRDSIRRLVMSTRPEEFGGVADAYQSAGTLLDQTIKELTTYASRLVADGNWGGESARAMLGRMARVQSYLGTLRSQIGDIPPSVQQAARELATAKETFEQATQEQYYTVDTGSYISRELGNDPDADAQRFLAELNGRLADAHGTLPARLPWDADLASSAPYLPAPVVRDSTPVGGGIEFPDQESTRPVARLASVDRAASPTSVTPPAIASTPAAPLAASVPGTAAPPTLGTTPGQVPGLITSTSGTPLMAQPTGYPPTTGLTPTGLPPVTAEPRRSPTGTRRSDGTPSDQPLSDRTRPDRTLSDRTSSDPTRSVLDEGPPGTRPTSDQARTPLGSVPHETGPSVRPGVVPVVDGTWPVTRTASSGGPTGAVAGTGGMPFMPMGGGPTGYEGAPAAHRTVAPPPDDSGLFRPAYDPGQPVVD
ncbi:WXG100 family type VII secretion target [Nonomuraea sp. NEAU-A123]|uniref:WXG100 family type VII secretion target n=1 Tax=Nonomuraea sp. NEAU-A123 TaxID=2839649 RepID=UPI001BE4B9AA|nr:hypothetical protein [Nonomuraea sp. NEAU-A123]MBT2230306.1 hypothetical protein [Nonomuraea sp. NEAU-A123]